MKKLLLYSLTLFVLPAFAQTPITILSTDMAQVGDVINRRADTLTPITGPGPAGANQNWVMTSVSQYVNNENTSVIAPSASGTSAYNSNSNQALTNDNQSWLYLNLTGSTMIGKGAYGDLLMSGNNLSIPVNPDMLIHNFPRNYGSNFTDGYGIDVTFTGSQVGQPSVYQVRFKQVGTAYDTTDGWGSLTTPVGTYNTLRVKRETFVKDTTWYKLFSFSSWAILSTKNDTTFGYTWLAKETKLAVAELSNDSTDHPKIFKWSLIPPITVSVEENANLKAELFPVPAADNISLRLGTEFENGEYFFTIYDVAGKMLMQEKVYATASSTYNFSVQDLPQGLYSWQLIDRNNLNKASGKLSVVR